MDAVLIAIVPGVPEPSVLATAPLGANPKVVEAIHQFGPNSFAVKDPSKSILQCHEGQRFYGPGYERGPWNLFVETIHWMRRTWPVATILYGGDNWHPREFLIMTTVAESELTELFFREGNEQYYQRFIDAGITVSQETLDRIAKKA